MAKVAPRRLSLSLHVAHFQVEYFSRATGLLVLKREFLSGHDGGCHGSFILLCPFLDSLYKLGLDIGGVDVDFRRIPGHDSLGTAPDPQALPWITLPSFEGGIRPR